MSCVDKNVIFMSYADKKYLFAKFGINIKILFRTLYRLLKISNKEFHNSDTFGCKFR